jgi:hypothetical protein
MPAAPLTDAELAVVAAVAGREGWVDLSSPPQDHAPRSLDEERAVARFQAAVPTVRDERAIRIRARVAIAVLTVVVLGGCWLVSPTRTAIGLIGAGIFSLIALRRSQRRAAAGRPPRRWSPSGPLRAR